MTIRMIAPVAALLAVALAVAGGGAARPAAATKLVGTATIDDFDVTKRCGRVGAATRKVLRIRCAQFGTYEGEPSAAGASLGWTWELALDAKGFTTGHAKETGTLILNFGPPGLLYLSLEGKQSPVGKATAKRARALTKGTWRVSRGTAGFTGRSGRGTYTFETARTNSETVFSVARLELNGSIT